MDQRQLTTDIVFFPGNGCVVRQTKNEKGAVTKAEILVRLVYADKDMQDAILDAVTKHIGG